MGQSTRAVKEKKGWEEVAEKELLKVNVKAYNKATEKICYLIRTLKREGWKSTKEKLGLKKDGHF